MSRETRAPARPARMAFRLTRAARLTRLLAREQRATLAGLPVVAGVVTAAAAPAYGRTYATPDGLARSVALARGNTTSLFLYGPLAADADAVQLAVWELGALTCLILALMTALRVVALGRGDEEAGRAELVRAQGVTPTALVLSQGVLVLVLSVSCGAACGAGLLALDLVSGRDAAAYGGAVAATCLLVGAVALLCCQLADDVAHARGAALLLVAAAFVGQGADAAQGWHWAGRLSPLGVRALVGPGGADDWMPVAVAVGAAAVLVAASARLSRSRDLGAGAMEGCGDRALRASRLRVALPGRRRHGPLTARDRRGRRDRPSRRPAGMTALVRRLEGRGLLAWAATAAGVGAVLTAMGSTTVELARQGAVASGSFGSAFSAADDPGVGFIRYIGTIVGIIAVVQAVALSGRAGSAEAGGLLETLRGTGMSSARVLATWWATASAGALASLGTAAALMAVVGDRVLDVSPADTVRLVLAQWPAAAAAAGLCVLCAGLAPAARHLAWAPVLASALIAELGGVLDLPQAVRDEAPFAQAGRWTSLWLLVVALAGLAGGALLIRSRDLRPR